MACRTKRAARVRVAMAAPCRSSTAPAGASHMSDVRGRPRADCSDGRLVLVAGADPDDAVDRGDPHLAVADATGLRGLDHDPGHVLDVRVVDEDLDADLRHQRDVVLRPPVDLGVALLPAVAADLADGHAGHPEGLQGGTDLFPLVRLDHRGHELHALTPLDSAVDWA